MFTGIPVLLLVGMFRGIPVLLFNYTIYINKRVVKHPPVFRKFAILLAYSV